MNAAEETTPLRRGLEPAERHMLASMFVPNVVEREDMRLFAQPALPVRFIKNRQIFTPTHA